MKQAQPAVSPDGSALTRAIETDRIYFEQSAELRALEGATLAWMPGLTGSAAAAVIHRVEPEAICRGGQAWITQAEAALNDAGVTLARIYLDAHHDGAAEVLGRAGYADREELAFVGNLPDPSEKLTFRPVAGERDWDAKLQFHRTVDLTPDGHGNRADDWVELERRKCQAGMEAYLAELNGAVVGAIGAVWGEDIVRAKNVVVHPAHRRRTIGSEMLCHVAAVGRSNGVFQQCVMAVRGETGERLYRASGMEMVGLQVEWSKMLGTVG